MDDLLCLTYLRRLVINREMTPILQEVIFHQELGEKPSPTVLKELLTFLLFLKEWNRLELQDGILRKTIPSHIN